MGFLGDIFGSKMKIPKLKEIDIDQELDKAFKSMQERLPEAQRLTRSIGEADTDTSLALLERVAPGSRDLISKQTQNLQEGLEGKLPADVQRAITDSAAARSQAGGFGGSQAASNLELRDFGLTSLNRIDSAMFQTGQALAQFRGLGAQAPGVNTMFFSPTQRLNFAIGERNKQYERDLMVAEEAARKDPVIAGIVQGSSKAAGAAIGAYFGGPMGAKAGAAAGEAMFKGEQQGPRQMNNGGQGMQISNANYQWQGNQQQSQSGFSGFGGRFMQNLGTMFSK
jgi:hypothetical protein